MAVEIDTDYGGGSTNVVVTRGIRQIVCLSGHCVDYSSQFSFMFFMFQRMQGATEDFNN